MRMNIFSQSALGFSRPARAGEARGLIPLILGAIAGGRAIYGAINANQKKQRNKGYINDAYRSAMARQQVHEGDVRQGTAEEMNRRGLGTSGAVRPGASKIASAMGAQSGYLAPSTTLGGRATSEVNRELGLERHDLDAAHTQALNENKADALNAQINSLANGVTGVAQAYGLAKEGAAAAALSAQGQAQAQSQQVDQIASQSIPGVRVTPSRIQSAYGVDDPSNWWGGVNGLNPLGAPGSSWNRKETVSAPPGLQNENFHL